MTAYGTRGRSSRCLLSCTTRAPCWREIRPAGQRGRQHDGFEVSGRNNGTPGGCKAALPIIETLTRLRSRSCIIDGEAVACDEDGVTSFNRVRYRHHDESISFTPST